MKHYFVFLAIIFGMIASPASAQGVKQKVAIYVTGDIENGYKKVIGSKLVTGITRSENYSAVERTADFLAEIAKEQDYQMSGAVSDNQIARLGQQFGVRYVLVADVEEVFESMFVSARMIDVQTAQITKSTEASQVVSNMESLTKLAENIVLELIGAPTIDADMVKLQGPYSTPEALNFCRVPEGYHIASKEEVEGIIKNYQLTGKKVSFPIYADIQGYCNSKTQYFTRYYYDKKEQKSESDKRNYDEWHIPCTLISSSGKSEILDLTYVVDYSYSIYAYDSNYVGVRNMAYTPEMEPGYVYVIKDNEKK